MGQGKGGEEGVRSGRGGGGAEDLLKHDEKIIKNICLGLGKGPGFIV